MSNKKKLTRDEQIEDIQAKLEAARQKRLALTQNAQASTQSQETDLRVRFQEYWAGARRQFGRTDRDLEDVLWAHLKAIEHTEEPKFEAGVLHFGLKKLT